MLLSGATLPAIILGGLLASPALGYFLMICLVAAVGISLFLGRYWCNWLCPRGSFLESLLGRISRGKAFPAFFRTSWFRLAILGVFMVMMTLNFLKLYPQMGVFDGMGLALVRVLAISTLVAVAIGIVIHPRAWCSFCPGGTMALWVGGAKGPLVRVNESSCIECGLCDKRCPLQLQPSSFRGSVTGTDGDCLKCFRCVSACPRNALSLQ